jgi:hypothetical protein
MNIMQTTRLRKKAFGARYAQRHFSNAHLLLWLLIPIDIGYEYNGVKNALLTKPIAVVST